MLLFLYCFVLKINAIEILDLKTNIKIQGGILVIDNDFEIDKLNDQFVTCFPDDIAVPLAYLNGNIVLHQSNGLYKNMNCFDVPAKQTKFKITTFITNSIIPSPSVIKQNDYQTLLISVSKFLYSPYKVNKQMTHIEGEFIENDVADSSDKTGLIYGPYYDTSPFSKENISLLMISSDSLLSLTNYKRRIEISHWGFVNVREFIHLQSNSAKIKNEAFSRLDYTSKYQRAPSIDNIAVEIPLSASRIYFRDDIGNISTSQIHTNQKDALKSKLLVLFFRFPLISGWKTQLEFGYQIPAYNCLRYIDGGYVFSHDFMSLLFENQVVEDFELEIIFPPHATDLELISASSGVLTTYFGDFSAYLDLAADRKTLVVKSKNLVYLHQSMIKVGYKHNNLMLMMKPFMLSLMFLLVFLTIMIMERMDFSILPSSNTGFDIHYSANKLRNIYMDFISYSGTVQEQVNAFKRSKDGSAFESFRQQFDDKVKALKKNTTNIEEEFANPEKNDKMSAIIKDVLVTSQEARAQAVQLQGKFQQTFVNAAKLVNGLMSGADYTAFELKNISDRDGIVEKIEEIINNL